MATTSVRPPAADVVGQKLVRDPDWWLMPLGLTCGVLSVLGLLVFPAGASHAEYTLMAAEILRGKAPIESLWSHMAPGIGLLYAGLGASSLDHVLSLRFFEALVALGLFPVFGRLTERLFDNERLGYLAAGLALLVHSQLEFEHTGQPEFFATALFAWSLLLVCSGPGRRREVTRWCVAGLLLGLAILLVPLLGTLWMVLAVLAGHSRGLAEFRRARLGSLIGCVCLGISAVLGVFVGWLGLERGLGTFAVDWLWPMLRSGFPTSLEQVVEYGYLLADRVVLRQSALLPAGMLAAFLLPGLLPRERAAMRLLLGIAVADLIRLTLTMEVIPGRFSATLPWLSMIAAVGWYKLFRRVLGLGRVGVVGLSGAVMITAALSTPVDVEPGSYWERSRLRLLALARNVPSRAAEEVEAQLYDTEDSGLSERRAVVQELKRLEAECDVFVEGDEPRILAMLGCPPQGRLVRPLDSGLADAAPELLARLSAELSNLRPRFVVVPPRGGDSSGSPALERQLPRSTRLVYATVAEVGGFAILESPRGP